MATPRTFFPGLAAALMFSTSAFSYSVILPDVPPSPPLPYLAEQDNFSGPASVQMALNSCPTVSQRLLDPQTDLYASILAHNTEPTLWFSDPAGMRGALSDPAFSPCGHWVDFSNTDRTKALGYMLYYMDSLRYLAPVSIGSGEHWVTVIGFQTDVKPPFSGAVTLQGVLFYDPLPGNTASMWVSGSTWLSDSGYWGVPLSKAGSAWNGKYVAIIEPPKSAPVVKVPERRLEGRILPPDTISAKLTEWLGAAKRSGLAEGPFEILRKDPVAERPILVKSAKYAYYLVPFKDSRLAAILNAYDGSFEELRYSAEPRRYVLDPSAIAAKMREALARQRVTVVALPPPEFQYEPGPLASRFAPTWESQATVKEATGAERRVRVGFTAEGRLVTGLER